jgi:sec-independent protein translocase protein TatA
MNIFGIGLPEMAVIAAIGLLVFGPKRLPELGKTLGRTLKGFQSASSEFEKELRSAMASPEALTGEDRPSPGLEVQATSPPERDAAEPSVSESAVESPAGSSADQPSTPPV